MVANHSTTIGWFSLASGTLGITKGQTLRLSVVNVGPLPTLVCKAMTLNPKVLHEEKFFLQPGESRDNDVDASSLDDTLFDRRGRVQIRALARCNTPTVRANMEVFDSESGKTAFILPLEEVSRS